MKILSIFLDMVRANRLKIFEPTLEKNNKLDVFLEEIGGTIFTNYITPGPDTTRALASYFSGKPPWENGCDTRNKTASCFLNSNLKTNIDIFEDYKYDQFFFADPGEFEQIFPKKFNLHRHNQEFDLSKFIDNISLTDNSHLFISLSDFHSSYDDYGANFFAEKIGYSKLVSSLSIIFKKFKPDTFDYIILFSDHGFKFSKEYWKQKKKRQLFLFNEDRLRPILIVREKNQKGLTYDNRMISISDLQKVYVNILRENLNKVLDIPERKLVCFEDHIDFSYSDFMCTEVFGLVNKEQFYVRNFNDCLLLNRKGEFISSKINEKYDAILFKETSYGKKYDYLKKILKPHKNLPDSYSDGSKRIKILKKIKDKVIDMSKNFNFNK